MKRKLIILFYFIFFLYSFCFSSNIISNLPIINISQLLLSNQSDSHNNNNNNNNNNIEKNEIIQNIGKYCREIGFFYISGHNIEEELQEEIENISKEYFNLNNEEKLQISMKKGGRAWRGSFLVGDELTSGIPDQKEGIYFGKDLGSNETLPLHGPNLWPNGILGERMKKAVTLYMNKLTNIGNILMNAIITDLGLNPNDFNNQFQDPTILFRFFHYPPHNSIYGENSQAVGEHTDYGYLTILKQDSNNGLQAKIRTVDENDPNKVEYHWIDVPSIPNTFVINLGDALQHNTGGLLIATSHRVKQRRNTNKSRYSYPFFYDPSFNTIMTSLENLLSSSDKQKIIQNKQLNLNRWDLKDPTQYQGTYGNYLIKKVAKVFPNLAKEVKLIDNNGEVIMNDDLTSTSKIEL